MQKRTFISRFTPSRTSPENLEKIFVQRHKLLDRTVELLRESALTQNKHHFLFIGPRGSGKSHLASLAVYRLRKDPELQDRLRIAWLPEDESSPSFSKFLQRIARSLHAEYPTEFPAPPLEELRGQKTEADMAGLLIDFLLKHLGTHPLLIVVENLDDTFRGLKFEGQKRWRAMLQEHPVAAVFATSQQLTEDISDRDKPFFGFFQIEHLEPLTVTEAAELLAKIAQLNSNENLAKFLHTPTGRARLRAIRHLSGGSHRVLIVLSEFITRESLDELVGAFDNLLDELTPYYQERLRWLPEQQREIVEYLCRCQRTVAAKEIARDLFIKETALGKQMKNLVEKGYIMRESVGRESRYELAEPLMRLCIEVKENRRGPIRLVVDFLRLWYDQRECETFLSRIPPDQTVERRYLEAAIAQFKENSDNPVVHVLKTDLAKARGKRDLKAEIDLLEELAETTKDESDWAIFAFKLAGCGQTEKALAVCECMLAIDPNTLSLLCKGTVFHISGLYEEAIVSLDSAIKIFPKFDVAWICKGASLRALNRNKEALEALEHGFALRNVQGAYPWAEKGKTLSALGRMKEAEEAFDQSLAIDPKDVNVWLHKAHTLVVLDCGKEALAATEKSLAINPSYVVGLGIKGIILVMLGRHEEAVAALERWLSEVAVMPNQQFLENSKYFYGRHIRAIMYSASTRSLWHDRIARLLQLCSQTGSLTQVGKALVESLNAIPADLVGQDLLDTWLAVWQEVGNSYPELEMPLRLFEIGLRYRRTQDARVLLDLLQEERKILCSLFGLADPETGKPVD
jgi:tetratricopeptide (TPR) repeat protein